MYSIEFSATAEKQFGKLEAVIQERILAVLERIRVRPLDFVKRLSGTSYYRVRVGDYRVIVDAKEMEQCIFVIEMGHRKNIYK
ncbi:MAG: type II toxin-antitoxin system RelE/ParE family toxin [Candidatus Diapherotrites archaeon]